jgi:hypothetical protein
LTFPRSESQKFVHVPLGQMNQLPTPSQVNGVRTLGKGSNGANPKGLESAGTASLPKKASSVHRLNGGSESLGVLVQD